MFFVMSMEKESCTNVCSVFPSFYEFLKLQSLEFDVSDVIPKITQKISPLVFFEYFLLILWRKILYKNFTEFLTIFPELMKF